MSQPIRGQGGHLGFSYPRKKWQHLFGTSYGTFILDVNSCSHSWEEVENVTANQRPGRPSWIFRSTQKVTTLVRDLIRNICTKLEVNRCSHYWEEVQNVSANQRPRRPFWIFRSAQKVTTLVWDLIRNICTKLEVNRWSHCWEVENVSVNQRPRRPSWISDRHENNNTW